MANDAATEWVGPYFKVVTDSSFVTGAGVEALNPNTAPAEVAVHYYSHQGVLVFQQSRSIPPSHRGHFDTPRGLVDTLFLPSNPQIFDFDGWVYLESDLPIFPAGFTHRLGSHELYPMNFYKAEGIKPTKFVLVPEDQLPDDLRPTPGKGGEPIPPG